MMTSLRFSAAFKRHPTLQQSQRLFDLKSGQHFSASSHRLFAHQKRSTGSVSKAKRELLQKDNASCRIDARLSSTEDSKPTKTSLFARISQPTKDVFRNHGFDALIFHSVTSAASLGIWYALASNGLDIPYVLGEMGFISPLSLLISRVVDVVGGGEFAYAYAMHKLSAPLRFLFTIMVSPRLFRLWRKEKPSSASSE